MSRSDTTFSIRYAVRVLERTARFWSRIDTSIKVFALLSGSGAIYALASHSEVFTLACGAFFALTQAIEFAVRPADKSALALGERGAYAKLLANQSAMSDEAIEDAYQKAVCDDEVTVMEGMRHIAYNDVLYERSADPSYAYCLTFRERVLAFIA